MKVFVSNGYYIVSPTVGLELTRNMAKARQFTDAEAARVLTRLRAQESIDPEVRQHITTVDVPSCRLQPLQQVIAALDFLNDAERVNIFTELQGIYCVHCGRKQPAVQRCQCANDD